jgi:hypothetical protein
MITTFCSRSHPGLLAGPAETVPLPRALRGGATGALMSIRRCTVPLNSRTSSAAGPLPGTGVVRGIPGDGAVIWRGRAGRKPDLPEGLPCR